MAGDEPVGGLSHDADPSAAEPAAGIGHLFQQSHPLFQVFRRAVQHLSLEALLLQV